MISSTASVRVGDELKSVALVSDGGGLGPHQLSDAFPAQPEPVHQHPFRVRGAPQLPVHDGCHLATRHAHKDGLAPRVHRHC